jgi:thioesterase domain-containing protein
MKGRLLSARMRQAFAGSGQSAARADLRDLLGMWRAPQESRCRLEVEYQALTTYVPQVYSGRITLFRARASPLFHFFPPDMGWAKLATEGVDIRVVPGSHVTMLIDPYVRVVAEELTACLAENTQAL